jgi:hypothetical protein
MLVYYHCATQRTQLSGGRCPDRHGPAGTPPSFDRIEQASSPPERLQTIHPGARGGSFHSFPMVKERTVEPPNGMTQNL